MTDTTAIARIDVDAIAATVAADIATRFGFKVDPQTNDVTHRGDSRYCTLAIEQSLGVFAMVVKTACVHLHMEPVDDGTIWVLGSLHYSHTSGGTNGSNIGTWWIRDGVVEQFRAS